MVVSKMGTKESINLEEGFTFASLKQKVIDVGGDMNSAWICVKLFSFQEPNESRQEEILSNVRRTRVIKEVEALLGGASNHSPSLEVLTPADRIIIRSLAKGEENCEICLEDRAVLPLACVCKICVDCFASTLKQNSIMIDKIKCPTNLHLITDIWTEPTYSKIGLNLMEILLECSMNLNMVYMRCESCKKTYWNTDPSAYKKCPRCNFDVCGFCGKKWDNSSMKSQPYMCSQYCSFVSYCTFELVNFAYDSSLTIPNRRFCPNCGALGVYDRKCKWHKCRQCNYEFCFYCLKKKSKCSKSAYDKKCSEPVIQTLDVLWCVHVHRAKTNAPFV